MSKLIDTAGIVLHQMKYGETSVIVKIYTEELGLQSYIVRGVRSKKAKIKYNLLQPGNILSLVVYYKEKSSLQNIREIKLAHHYEFIPYDVIKSSILIFMIEVFFKSVIEEEPNTELYLFLNSALLELDQSENQLSHFHLVYMIKLSKYLGFYPQLNYSDSTRYFDLQEGVFQTFKPVHEHHLSPEMGSKFFDLIKNALHNEPVALDKSDRNELLNRLIEYYRLHLPTIQEIKSHHVLREVLSS